MKIHESVLPILSTLVFTGQNVMISEQIERKLYVRTNEVLEALGGKWNRKAKAHVFECDPIAAVENALLLGEVTTAKDLGYFPTPTSLAAKLVKLAGVQKGDRCLEPSCGDGRIVMAMLEAGAGYVLAVEVDGARLNAMLGRSVAAYGETDKASFCLHSVQQDFLKPIVLTAAPNKPFDRVVMNPPFLPGYIQHVEKAFSMLRPRGVLVSVLPNGVTFRNDRPHREFRDFVTSLDGEIKPLPEGSFKESGTNAATCTVRLVRR
jgi:16S rRNA G966 N2-methylase RsmD